MSHLIVEEEDEDVAMGERERDEEDDGNAVGLRKSNRKRGRPSKVDDATNEDDDEATKKKKTKKKFDPECKACQTTNNVTNAKCVHTCDRTRKILEIECKQCNEDLKKQSYSKSMWNNKRERTITCLNCQNLQTSNKFTLPLNWTKISEASFISPDGTKRFRSLIKVQRYVNGTAKTQEWTPVQRVHQRKKQLTIPKKKKKNATSSKNAAPVERDAPVECVVVQPEQKRQRRSLSSSSSSTFTATVPTATMALSPAVSTGNNMNMNEASDLDDDDESNKQNNQNDLFAKTKVLKISLGVQPDGDAVARSMRWPNGQRSPNNVTGGKSII